VSDGVGCFESDVGFKSEERKDGEEKALTGRGDDTLLGLGATAGAPEENDDDEVVGGEDTTGLLTGVESLSDDRAVAA